MCGREDNNKTDPKESECREIHRINLRIMYSCDCCEHGNKSSRSRNHYCLGNEKTLNILSVEKTKTHILCSIIFFLENRVVYDIIWKNTLK